MWYLTGDLHGEISPFFQKPQSQDDKVIVLGDNGANFYWNGSKLDIKFKNLLNNYGYKWYMIKGNHDKRPENLKDIKIKYDENVNGIVYYQEQYPNINYFKMFGEYTIDNKKVLVMGGANRIDKEWRLYNKIPWFVDEQMSKIEMDNCYKHYSGKSFDYVLTHTCPLSFIPKEFDTNNPNIDYSMEYFFNDMENNIIYDWWYFGHYHKDMNIKGYNATILYESLIPLGTNLKEEIVNV